MQTYDIVMLVILGLATAYGAWKGLAWQVASLAAIVVSYAASMRFREQLAPLLKADPPWNLFLAMFLIYVGTSLAIWIAFYFVSAFIDRLKLKEFDRQIGALVGLGKGALVCVIATLFAITLLDEPRRRAIINSHSGYYIALALDKAEPLMPNELHDFLHPYIQSLDERLHPPQRFWNRLLGSYTPPDPSTISDLTRSSGLRPESLLPQRPDSPLSHRPADPRDFDFPEQPRATVTR